MRSRRDDLGIYLPSSTPKELSSTRFTGLSRDRGSLNESPANEYRLPITFTDRGQETLQQAGDVALGREDGIKQPPVAGMSGSQGRLDVVSGTGPRTDNDRSLGSVRSTRRHASKRRSRALRTAARPNIKVDTSVGGPLRSRPRKAYPVNDSYRVEGTGRHRANGSINQTAFVTLADLKSLGLEDHHPQSRRQDHNAQSEPSPSASNNVLLQASQTLIDISPSDRPIPIGISFDSGRIPVFQETPISAYPTGPVEQAATQHRRIDSGGAAMTPTIIITPAREQSAWSASTYESSFSRRHKARPTSSIYSQATAYPQNTFGSEPIPPLPPLPKEATWNQQSGSHGGARFTADHASTASGGRGTHHVQSILAGLRDSTVTTFEEDDDSPAKGRVLSTLTTFEDETPRTDVAHFAQTSKNLKIDTIAATARWSRGWWNVITTPFDFARSATPLSKVSPRDGEATPELPMLGAAAGMGNRSNTDARPDLRHGSPGFPSPSVSLASDQWEYDSLSVLGKTPTPSLGQAKYQTPVNGPFGESYIIPQQPEDPSTPASNPRILQWARELDTDRTPPKPLPAFTTVPTNMNAFGQSHNSSGHMSIQSIISPEDREIPVILGASTEYKPLQTHNPYRMPQGNNTSVADKQYPSLESRIATDQGNQYSSEKSAVSYPPPDAHYTPSANSMPKKEVPASTPPNGANDRTPAPIRPLPAFTPQPVRPWQTERVVQASPPTFSPPAYTRHPPAPINLSFSPPPVAKGRFTQVPLPERPQKTSKFQSRWKKWRQKKRYWLCGSICLGIIVIILAIVMPVMTISRQSETTEAQSQWLNLTGFPPIPTGVSTVIRPDVAAETSACVFPSTMWSCALPKEDQAAVAPNDANQPNFKLEIQFFNSSSTDSGPGSTLPIPPSPDAPSLEDQAFLGNTTDQNSEPFEGEETPFLISFLSPNTVPSRVVKRQTRPTDSADFESVPDLTLLIPEPSSGPDGLAAPANLVPLPFAQPLRLYNRGEPNENYGFYTYFDRSIFLQSTALLSESDRGRGELSADRDGGSAFEDANVRCTWAQTRFLVQIWTNTGSSRPLLAVPGSPSSTTSASPAATSSPSSNPPTTAQPGSFPYPITITMDRHGGSLEDKMVYCYGIDDDGRLEPRTRKFQLERRNFGGVAINPAQGPFGNVSVTLEDGGPGGIDGGTGGCMCQWQNWAIGG